MSILRPQILILSSKFDYSTDHVAYRLSQRDVPYLRLNRDSFPDMELSLELIPLRLHGRTRSLEFELHQDILRSVYFRAPVFLRDNFQPGINVDEQFSRSQWAAFIRALTVFDTARWLNHPRAVYQAEVKPFQLRVAAATGLAVPQTVVTNSATHCCKAFTEDRFVMKTLDSVVLRDGDDEAFIYTNLVSKCEFSAGSIANAPVIAQRALLPKTDIRVTVVGDRAFAAGITRQDGESCPVDWRLQKGGLTYSRHTLPPETEKACIRVVHDLGLGFGGVDLALSDGKYWFIEVNPTGEWSWLMEPTGYEIDQTIAAWLAAA